MIRKILKILLCLILIPVIAFAGIIAVLTLTEYKPAEKEEAEVISDSASLSSDEIWNNKKNDLTLLSWNIGYAGLGRESEFFMDGGSDVRSADKETVGRYLAGIKETVGRVSPDILMLQEIDADSTRTFHIDERPDLAVMTAAGEDADASFAPNYKTLYVPYPVPPIGKVTSGLMTVSSLDTSESSRLTLPCPFSWPVRLANLKRCLLVTRIPLGGGDAAGHELVLVNLHLEAYDDGSGKLAQTKVLNEFLSSEYKKGNYVIAGGDFNQIFPGSDSLYPNDHPDLWAVGALTEEMLPEGFSYAFDSRTPTCRLLNQPYDPEDTANTQHYVIDGFILSPNVELKSVETLDEGFVNSDHNPVLLNVSLM